MRLQPVSGVERSDADVAAAGLMGARERFTLAFLHRRPMLSRVSPRGSDTSTHAFFTPLRWEREEAAAGASNDRGSIGGMKRGA